MKTFLELYNEETTSNDVASVDTKLKMTKRKLQKKKLKTVEEKVETPADILRDYNIKVKSVEMDEESYVVLLYSKSDIKTAKKMLEKEGYEITIVGSVLYVH